MLRLKPDSIISISCARPFSVCGACDFGTRREHGPDLGGADDGRRVDVYGGERCCDGERSPGERVRSCNRNFTK